MNIVMWILAGGALGWAGLRLLGINEQRGTIGSLSIGALAGLIGSQLLAPMMSSASACLAIGNMIENRFGI